jgi:hypothetical protein
LSRWSHWFSAYLLSQPLLLKHLLKHLLEAKGAVGLRVQALHLQAPELVQALERLLALARALQQASLERSLRLG